MSLSPYSSWRVGRNRISFTSTSSGWLMANATARANESAGIATPHRTCWMLSATSGSVMLSGSSVATAPGEMTVVRML